MEQLVVRRRAFLRTSAVLAGAALTGLPARAAGLNVRQEWADFKKGSHYASLLIAIKKMQANTNAADPGSWAYWANIHMNYCPHGLPYFLAWHRGYLYYFEQRLRTVCGDQQLVLPYWNYFANPNLPAEFTNASASNPLYTARVNTDVRQALDLTAFGPTVLQFPRGQSPAFEPILEDAPHNPIHNIIGGLMADMSSPLDPIFWLHHANIDRLWAAWTAAGGGRAMPANTTAYWSDNFTYASNLTLARSLPYSTRTSLNSYYANETMPTTLPALLQTGLDSAPAGIVREGMLQAGAAQEGAAQDRAAQDRAAPDRAIPAPTTAFSNTGARSIDAGTFATVGATRIGLDDQSVNVPMPVPSEHQTAVTRIARGLPSATVGVNVRFSALRLTLTGVEATRAGRAGGYYFNVWLTVAGVVPTAPGAGPARIKAGTLGAFQIAASSHHAPGTVYWDITPYLRDVAPADLATLTVWFERVNGDNSPRGAVIGVGEARLDLSSDA